MIVQGIKIKIIKQIYIAVCGGDENIVYANTRITKKPIMNIQPQKLIGGFITVIFFFEFIVPPSITKF